MPDAQKEWDKMTDEEKEKMSKAMQGVLKALTPKEEELLRASFGIEPKKRGDK